MRKKSHISLAGYLMNNMKVEGLREHRKAFMIGSILPDCVPSFLTKRHTINETFEILRNEIRRITEDYNAEKGINGYYCRHLGVITHYIADYFTFPHNETFRGTIREHCVYEKELKDTFRAYVESGEADRIREKNGTFKTVEEICQFIKLMHEKYLEAVSAVKEDCLYIVELCYRVVDAILQIFELKHYNNVEAAAYEY
ncbi:MAG: zinc dependent phospholipase C family protein [Lachnospiraceae bacterium]|nr:zinc dependent phospholipase C family protein [Lachnospiraceae bacterium]